MKADYLLWSQAIMQEVGSNNGRPVKSTFWKKSTKTVPGSIKPVYGAMHPPRKESPRASPKMNKTSHKRTGSTGSFQDFQESTNDAWDAGDDELCILTDVAKSTALNVLSSHSQLQSAGPCRPEISEEGKAEAMQRLATQREMLTMMSTPLSTSPNYKELHGPGLGVRQGSPPRFQFHQTESKTRPQSSSPSHNKNSSSQQDGHKAAKMEKFCALLQGPETDLNELRQISWSGIPPSIRGTAWRLLSGYLPAHSERREAVLSRKREEYFNFVKQYYDNMKDDFHQETYRQIHIDIPRMNPLVPLFQQETVQEIFERILFIWAIRHPASGYVQGMNDLLTPFFVVFLEELVDNDPEIETFNVARLPEKILRDIEADSFWCLSKLLDGIQDNYTFAQPGIQTKVNQLKELIQRIDAPLHQHLRKHHIEYLQFTFRWMNNLLMRELPLKCTIRLWDTYHSEINGFATFHLYVCAAFLCFWSKELQKQNDFQSLMIHLQNMPTQNWGNEQISLLVAEAYRLKYMFADAPNHLHARLQTTTK